MQTDPTPAEALSRGQAEERCAGSDDPMARAKARQAARDASGEMHVEGSIYEGMEAALVQNGRTVGHVFRYADAVAIAAAIRSGGPSVPFRGQAEEREVIVSGLSEVYQWLNDCPPIGTPGTLEMMRKVRAVIDEVVIDYELMADGYKWRSGKRAHTLECATSVAPAMEPGPCDCTAIRSGETPVGEGRGSPEGWALVPIVPTEAMKSAATEIAVDTLRGHDTALNWTEAEGVWSSMLAASPTPPAAEPTRG